MDGLLYATLLPAALVAGLVLILTDDTDLAVAAGVGTLGLAMIIVAFYACTPQAPEPPTTSFPDFMGDEGDPRVAKKDVRSGSRKWSLPTSHRAWYPGQHRHQHTRSRHRLRLLSFRFAMD